MITWVVSSSQSGKKILEYVKEKFLGKYSARFLKRAIEKSLFFLNGRVENFASKRVYQGDQIVCLEERLEEKPEEFDASRFVIFEDEHLFIGNKMGKILTETIAHIFFPQYFLINRLDRDTSGVLLFAKSETMAKEMQNLFRKRKVKKQYWALVDKIPEQTSGMIDIPLERLKEEGKIVWGKGEEGKSAVTEWKVLKSGANASLILCLAKTGRTHQIRVHLKSLGHPILGDWQYVRKYQCSYFPKRLCLHAKQVQFVHPITKKNLVIQATIPHDFSQAMKDIL